MLRKKDNFTVVTPIPGYVPRKLAIDILHSHSEVITVNPLVLDHKPIPAPQDAATDEYYATWYEITERIQFIPGMGRLGSSTISFKGCFHNTPWGLQTHINAPMNVDVRNTYRIAGNQPDEPPEPAEIGLAALGVPAEGLYLRMDIEVRCNVTVQSFVRSQLKKACGEMVRRIIKKAELLDAGALQGLMQDGRLRTINPADRSNPLKSPLPSPTSLHYPPSVTGSPPPLSPPVPYQVPRVQSAYGGYFRPDTAGSQGASGYSLYATPPGYIVPDGPQELPGTEANPPSHQAVEMPGDFYYHASPSLQASRQSPQQSPHQSPRPSSNRGNRESPIDPRQHTNTSPSLSLGGQWTAPAAPRPASMSSLGSQCPSDNKGLPLPLEPHRETNEEHQEDRRADTASPHPPPPQYPYNPATYGQVQPTSKATQYGQGHVAQRFSFTQ